jgi:hypothetical protein
MVPRLGRSTRAAFAGCAEFLSRSFSPGDGAEGVKSLACGAKGSACLGNSTLAAKPGAVRKQDATSQKGPLTDVPTQCRLKLHLGIVIVGEKRLRISNLDLTPTR